MSTPPPRPALKKAADAHVHPAAPGQPHALRHAPAAVPSPRAADPGAADADAAPAGGASVAPITSARSGSRLSGPPQGTTSDSLRRSGKRGGHRPAKDTTKTVKLTVSIPKSLRKELRAAVKADRTSADAVVTTLLRSWLDG